MLDLLHTYTSKKAFMYIDNLLPLVMRVEPCHDRGVSTLCSESNFVRPCI
jgi:hypothetical protein